MYCNVVFSRWGIVGTSPKTQAGGPPRVLCPRPLIPYLPSSPTYPEAVLPSATWGTPHAVLTGTLLTDAALSLTPSLDSIYCFDKYIFLHTDTASGLQQVSLPTVTYLFSSFFLFFIFIIFFFLLILFFFLLVPVLRLLLLLIIIITTTIIIKWHYSPRRAFPSWTDVSQSALFFWPLFPVCNFALINICLYTVPPSVFWSSSYSTSLRIFVKYEA